MRATNRQPRTVRWTEPSPPRMLVPPTMIPVRTVNVRKLPADAWALRTRDASSVPASAAAVAAQGERRDPDRVDPHAAEPRRLGVAAGRVDVAAERRPAEQDRRGDRDHDHHPGRARDAQRSWSRRTTWNSGWSSTTTRLPWVTIAPMPLDDERHRERPDQRVDPELGDDDAVREADRQPDARWPARTPTAGPNDDRELRAPSRRPGRRSRRSRGRCRPRSGRASRRRRR